MVYIIAIAIVALFGPHLWAKHVLDKYNRQEYFTRVPSLGVLMFLGGLATLCIPVLVHLLTLPPEFDTSFNRALPMLSSGSYIPPEDIPAAKKILLACALTYVSNSLIGLLNVWRWIRLLRR